VQILTSSRLLVSQEQRQRDRELQEGRIGMFYQRKLAERLEVRRAASRRAGRAAFAVLSRLAQTLARERAESRKHCESVLAAIDDAISRARSDVLAVSEVRSPNRCLCSAE
jgi:replication fork clamp-binding protein CrfC